jgi:hypothetical protein
MLNQMNVQMNPNADWTHIIILSPTNDMVVVVAYSTSGLGAT